MTPRRILVIRRDNVGDLVCTTPTVALLRAAFPGARIAALVNSYNAEVLAGNPDLDQVYVYTKLKHRAAEEGTLKTLWARLRTLVAIRRERFEVAILCKASWDGHGLRLARQCGIAHTIGYAAVQPAPRQPDIALPASDPLLHEVEAVARLVAPLGIERAPGPLRVFPEAGRVAVAQQRLAALGDRPRLALHVSARARSRRWPEARWVEAARLAASNGWGIVLLWSPGASDNPFHPGDDDLADRLTRAIGEVAHVACDTPRISELVAILACCDAFIGADGGAMHLAAAVGLPVVALFEHTPLKTRHWYPWQVPHEIVSGPAPEVAGIETHRVMEALDRLPVGQRASAREAPCAGAPPGR